MCKQALPKEKPVQKVNILESFFLVPQTCRGKLIFFGSTLFLTKSLFKKECDTCLSIPMMTIDLTQPVLGMET